MSKWSERREKFRALLSGDACIHPASVFDPVSARIAEDLGFEAGIFAGSVASLTVLGAPDHILLTLSEFAGQATRICRASALPLMVDADHGYGNALNVMRTVEELEQAGVCGLSIEDTALPMRHDAKGKPPLISIEEGVGKMRAAVEARSDLDLVIAGRTSAAALTSLEDAVARVTAYQEAGVDAIFLVGVKSRADLETIAQHVRVPIIVGGGGKELADRDFLTAQGVRIALQGHQPIAAAFLAVEDTLRALRQGEDPASLKTVPDGAFMRRIMRDERYADWIDRFL